MPSLIANVILQNQCLALFLGFVVYINYNEADKL